MRLNTLGGVRVIADGNVVAGAAAQPRRLAVLALLARAGRAGVTREKILALLWPDEPDERARRSLNQAVYSLRRDLGADDTLPPDREIVAFARQVRAASALGSSGVSTTAPTSLESPSTTAIVRPTEAALSPPPALPPASVDVAEAASAATEVGSARPVATTKRRWWIGASLAAAAVFVATASVKLLDRDAPETAAPSRQQVVAVGVINDYASADSSGIARALRDMLATSLARSPELTVVSGSRLLEVERQMNGGAPSVPGAIVPVARQAGATTLVDGALYLLGGDTLRLDPRVTSLRDGNVLRAYTVTGPDPFVLADSATARLVAYLGYSPPRGSVADATTRSVTAYRLYEEGLRSFYLRDIASSLRLFDAALVEDSTFAMAANYAARASGTSRSEYLRRLRRAVTLAERASDRERLIIEGGWAEANNSPSLRAIGETLAVRYPTEVEGHYYLGRALVNAGAFSGPEPTDSVVVEFEG